MIISDKGDGDFEQAPTGTHIATCIKIIDIGTQLGEYQGKPNQKRQVILMWELPNELMSQGDALGKPFIVQKFYTASLSEKATLRKDLINWRGRAFSEDELRGFELKNILGKCCQLQLTANDKGRVGVTGVMSLVKGTPTPPQINPSFYFSLDPKEFNQGAFDALADWYKDKITKSPEWAELHSAGHMGEDAGFPDENIPF